MKFSLFILFAVVVATAVAEEAKPVPNVAPAADRVADAPVPGKSPEKNGNAIRALFGEISKQISNQLGERSAMFGPKDMINALQMKYLTPEGQNVVNSVLRMIPLFNEE